MHCFTCCALIDRFLHDFCSSKESKGTDVSSLGLCSSWLRAWRLLPDLQIRCACAITCTAMSSTYTSFLEYMHWKNCVKQQKVHFKIHSIHLPWFLYVLMRLISLCFTWQAGNECQVAAVLVYCAIVAIGKPHGEMDVEWVVFWVRVLGWQNERSDHPSRGDSWGQKKGLWLYYAVT